MPSLTQIALFSMVCVISVLAAKLIFYYFENRILKKKLDDVCKEYENAKTEREDARGRLEKVIELLRTEVATLGNDLALCRDPFVVRERLRRLLSETKTS